MSKVLLALYVLATSAGLVLLKLGTDEGLPVRHLNNKLQLSLNFPTAIGVVLYGLSFALYVYLISKNDLGYIIPLTTALVYVIIFVASYFIFHEVFTLLKILGIALILSGLILINLKK